MSSLLVFRASDVHGEGTVERMDSFKSLSKHMPTFVLCAWMPSGIDFTSSCRSCASCQEYVLLGPPDSSNSGDVWATWGKMNSELIEEYGLDPDELPPHEKEKFQRTNLSMLGETTLCRFDVSRRSRFSSVVSFRREVDVDEGGEVLAVADDGVCKAEVIPPLHEMSQLNALLLSTDTIDDGNTGSQTRIAGRNDDGEQCAASSVQ